jgi:hypothetical protein
MADIVNLQSYQTKVAEKKGFSPWRKRFGEAFSRKTRLSDLSEGTLYFLACPSEENAVAFYELIMGVLGLGEALKFYYLKQTEQMIVMDIHLFLLDQVRFEMMRRLGWIRRLPCEKQCILEMVQSFAKMKARVELTPPELSKSHPEFDAYEKVSDMDKMVFIRRLFPKAVEAFKKKIKL